MTGALFMEVKRGGVVLNCVRRFLVLGTVLVFLGLVAGACTRPNARPVTGEVSTPSTDTRSTEITSQNLVPVSSQFSDWLPFSMDIPEGWRVQATELRDLVTIYRPNRDYPVVEVRTRKLGTVQPLSEEEQLAALNRLGLQNIKVKATRVPGASVAYEVSFDDPRRSPKLTVVGLRLYGAAQYSFVDFTAESDEFVTWEPIMRTALKTFIPTKLDIE